MRRSDYERQQLRRLVVVAVALALIGALIGALIVGTVTCQGT